MKIDLHCHTKKTKIGDSPNRNINSDRFRQKVICANVQIIAITNHNHFDLAQFIEFNSVVTDFCLLWPGIELDVNISNAKRIHLIVIINPKQVDEFNTTVHNLVGETKPDDFNVGIASLISSFSSLDVIYIPHFMKAPGLSLEDVDTFRNLFIDKWRLLFEAQNVNSMGIFINHEYSSIVGSDVHDWDTYELSSFSELRLPVDNFEQFCMLSKRAPSVVNSILNKKKVYNVVAHPNQKVDVPL